MVAQGTDDIEERITGFERNEHVGRTERERDSPLNETFPNNDGSPSWLRGHSRSAAYPSRYFSHPRGIVVDASFPTCAWKRGGFLPCDSLFVSVLNCPIFWRRCKKNFHNLQNQTSLQCTFESPQNFIREFVEWKKRFGNKLFLLLLRNLYHWKWSNIEQNSSAVKHLKTYFSRPIRDTRRLHSQ